mmetsp:Transcript_16782/g.47335  ORF Transcript_16782/g.47335 Transcript_16782/m.47335 type:complete len:207 (-) Transcript_16782:524-1144(-)
MGLPEGSVPMLCPPRASCSAPSATTTVQLPCSSSFFSTYSRIPPEPWTVNEGISGMRHRSTHPEARLAWVAMNPDWRPISFTRPTPRYALEHSVLAASIAFTACSTAVSKPNVLSMSRMSLSMDLGMPTTAQVYPRRLHSAWMAAAPALPPLPPTTNTMLSPRDWMESTILSMSAPPRDVPSTVPPSWWIPLRPRDVSTRGGFSVL